MGGGGKTPGRGRTDLLVAAAAVRVGAEKMDLARPAEAPSGAVMGSLKMYCFNPSVDVLDAHLPWSQDVSWALRVDPRGRARPHPYTCLRSLRNSSRDAAPGEFRRAAWLPFVMATGGRGCRRRLTRSRSFRPAARTPG
jgi:hypothetical protein